MWQWKFFIHISVKVYTIRGDLKPKLCFTLIDIMCLFSNVICVVGLKCIQLPLLVMIALVHVGSVLDIIPITGLTTTWHLRWPINLVLSLKGSRVPRCTKANIVIDLCDFLLIKFLGVEPIQLMKNGQFSNNNLKKNLHPFSAFYFQNYFIPMNCLIY